MATYEEIYGKRVEVLDADPTLTSANEGQVWYNSTSGTLKSLVAVEAWVASSPMSTPPRIFSGGDGPPTAGWAAGGGSANPNDIANTEEFNGSGWAAGGSLPDARYGLAGVGPQTAALSFGGNTGGGISAASLEYDGSSWANPASMPQGRQYINRAGTQTAALAFGGSNPGPTSVTTTSAYDGSSWTAGGGLPVGSEYAGGTGTQTAALSAGGYFQPGGTAEPTATLYYDGSSWSAQSGALPAGRWNTQAFGTQTDARIVAGQPTPNQTTSLLWDGTSWTTSASLATARNGATAVGLNGGPTAAGWVAGGSGTLVTEEFNKSINTFTAGGWASGGVLPAAWYGVGSSTNGTQDAAIVFAGNNPGAYTGNTSSFEYDGSSWSANPSMGTARAYLCGFGTSTAAVGAGGLVPPGATAVGNVEEYTTSWTAGNTIPQAGWNQGACGTLTAGIVAFGTNPGYPGQYDKAFEYDGTNWTAITDAPTDTNDSKGMGTQTSALFAGGGPPSPEAKQSYEWNGSSWATGGTLAVDHKAGATLGSSKDAGIVAGGHTSPQTAVEGYDGTAWSSRPSMATSRGRAGMSGTEASGVVAGGNPSATTATEEWTGETSTATAKTLTTS